MTSPLVPTETGVLLRVTVQPRASRDEVAGRQGDSLRIRLRAPPVEGAANQSLIRFLAQRLDVSRSAVTLVSGATGRRKLVAIIGLRADTAASRLGLKSGVS